jgi:hypothetical protein
VGWKAKEDDQIDEGDLRTESTDMRKGSGDSKDTSSSGEHANADEDSSLGSFMQTSSFRNWATSKFRTEKLRSWEAKVRKQELQEQSPKPEDLLRPHRFWELKLRKGELDPLLRKSKETWLLDRVAQIPETLQIGLKRTFWEVKTRDTDGNEKRCFSMPVRERPPSLCPSSRPSLREGYEKCAMSDEDILGDVFSEYFNKTDEEILRKSNLGRTLMVHDIKNRFSIEDVLGIFDEFSAEHVDYVFLPLGVWETKKSKNRDSKRSRKEIRNKAYCFVHFSDVAASEAFVDRLSRYEPPHVLDSNGEDVRERKMYTSTATTQAVVPNLLRLVDIHNKKWHPRAGMLAIRLGDGLVPANVLALRQFLQGVLRNGPENAPGCLRRRSICHGDATSGAD